MGSLADLSVLPELGKAKWTTPQVFGYELALEGIRQAIGFYARQIADASDQDAIAAFRAEQAAWAARADQLDPLDTRAVDRVLEDADMLLSAEDDDPGD